MFDSELLREKLIQISEALDRVARRFEGIHSADDFLSSEHGMDMLDGICMMLIAVGASSGRSCKRSDKLIRQAHSGGDIFYC